VVEKFRGDGLGKLLMASIVAHPDFQGLCPWSLAMPMAWNAQFGFQPVKSPERHTEIHGATVLPACRAIGSQS